MKKNTKKISSAYISLLLTIIVITSFGIYKFTKINQNAAPENLYPVTTTIMNIQSPAFENNGKIPSKYTCDAENISPELVFSNVPENTQSLTLISHDPDAPIRGGWTHWVIINMDPAATGIAENSKPDSGLETTTNFGNTGYGGPCPPNGSHRYYFYLYALNTTLDLDASATKEDVETAIKGHIIEKAELMGTYQRR